MNKFVLAGLITLMVFAVSSDSLAAIKFGVTAGTCAVDRDIAQDRRDALGKVAMAFITSGLGSNSAVAYSQMTAEAKKSVSPENLASMLRAVQATGQFTNIKIAHTYLLQTVSGSDAESKVICGPVDGDEWVSVSAKPGIAQGYVLISADTINNSMAFAFWLLHEGGTWRIEYFNASLSGIVGRGPKDILTLARKQRDTGHSFNAAVLYVGLQGIINRGPAFQLGILQTTRNDLQSFNFPAELQGPPPFHWKFDDVVYPVSQVSIMGVQHEFGLVIVLPQDKWDGEEAADKRNHVFLNGFIATHPDYSQVFGFLVARAMKPDNSGGFATVYSVGKGYVPRKPNSSSLVK